MYAMTVVFEVAFGFEDDAPTIEYELETEIPFVPFVGMHYDLQFSDEEDDEISMQFDVVSWRSREQRFEVGSTGCQVHRIHGIQVHNSLMRLGCKLCGGCSVDDIYPAEESVCS